MHVLRHHYAPLAGSNSDCEISHVEFDSQSHTLTLSLESACTRVVYPERTIEYVIYAHADARICRGFKSISVRSADKPNCFTLFFKDISLDVLRAVHSIQGVAFLIHIEWSPTQAITRQALERGLDRRRLAEVRHVGLYEKNFGAGRDYVSVMMRSLNESIRFLGQQKHPVGIRALSKSWYESIIRNRVDPTVKVARTLKNSLDRLLTRFASPSSNGFAEGFNSGTEWFHSAARGFRIFEHYRIGLLFHRGKLSLNPKKLATTTPHNPDTAHHAKLTTFLEHLAHNALRLQPHLFYAHFFSSKTNSRTAANRIPKRYSPH